VLAPWPLSTCKSQAQHEEVANAAMKADARTEAAVMAVLNLFSDTCARRNLEDVVGLFAPDADIVVVASETGQRWSGAKEVKAFFERLFSRPLAYSFSWDWYWVWSAGSVAWVMTEGAEHLKGEHQHASFPYRMSAVLERRREEWRLVLLHGSEPAGS
jgi:uncharacterized protein (TIGR02246 family)